MSLTAYTSSIFILLIFMSCEAKTNESETDLVATAFGQKLYKSELITYLSDAKTASDTQFIVSRYVDGWLMNRIMYDNAKQIINLDQSISNKIEDYKKSLYIYELERQILRDHLDKDISNEEILDFYSNYKKDFILNDNISRTLVVKLPKLMDNDTFVNFWKSEDLPAIKTYLSDSQALLLLDDKKWYEHSYLNTLLPQKLMKKINFNKRETYTFVEADIKYYVKILESLKSNSNAPVSYIEDEIKNRILNERGELLIRTKRQELFQKSIINKDISINSINE